MKDLYSSYKDLPLSIYQIQDKYRDEARPRAGLLRGREFTMKDAYSFDYTDAGLDASYQAQRDAYERIFQRLGLEYVIVNADNGAHGRCADRGVPAPDPVGEDTFVRSAGGYAANVEAFSTAAPDAIPFDAARAGHLRLAEHADDRTRSCAHERASGAPARRILRRGHPQERRAGADSPGRRARARGRGLPGDREVDEKRVEVAFAPAVVETATAEDFENNPLLVKGYIGPWSPTGAVLGEESATGIRYLPGPSCQRGHELDHRRHLDQKHVHSLVAGRDFFADGFVEVANVRAGDPAPDGSGPVELARGMEIGHVFQLGRFFAETLGPQGAERERQARHGHDGLVRHRRDAHPRDHRRAQQR